MADYLDVYKVGLSKEDHGDGEHQDANAIGQVLYS